MNRIRVPSAAAFLILAVLALTPQAAWSVPLPNPSPAPFVDVPLAGTTSAARPELAGVVLEDVLKPYGFVSSDGALANYGEVQNRVVRSSVDGTIDFYWRLIPSPHPLLNPFTMDGQVIAFRIGGFGNYALDADWRSDGVGAVPPNTARHFGNGFVNFLFDPGVGVPDESRFFFLDTQATAYAEVGHYDMLGGVSSFISPEITTFAPVPEPAAAGLIASALATLWLGRFAIARRA